MAGGPAGSTHSVPIPPHSRDGSPPAKVSKPTELARKEGVSPFPPLETCFRGRFSLRRDGCSHDLDGAGPWEFTVITPSGRGPCSGPRVPPADGVFVMTRNDDWSPDEPLGTEAFEQGDEAIEDASRVDS